MKNSAELNDEKICHLKLCDDLLGHKIYKVFFGNWLTTLDLLHHFRSKGMHVFGTIRLNHLRGCSLDAIKDLMKNGRGAMDYHYESNSGIMAVKWVNHSMVNLASHFVGIESIGELERWCEKEKVRKNILYPQIVQQYNRSMGGVDLVVMLLLLYRITCNVKCWNQKIFWHLIDMVKISDWILHRRHFRQNGKPHKNQKCLVQFSLELSGALILTNKVNPSSSRGRHPIRRSLKAHITGKSPTQALSVTDVRFDQVARTLAKLCYQQNQCRYAV